MDDLNRLTPAGQQRAFNTLLSWSQQAAKQATTASGTEEYKVSLGVVRFVVPVWPTLEALQTIIPSEERVKINPSSDNKNEIRWHLIDLAAYSSREKKELVAMLSANSQGSQAINSAKLTSNFENKISHIIEVLNGDPFLCGVEPEILRSYALANQYERITRGEIIKRMFEAVVQDAAKETAILINEAGKGVRATSQEIIRAIEHLLELVVQSDTPEPEWQQIREFVGDREADLLHILASTNRLGWVSSDNALNVQERWRWKHTRLRDALLGRWLAQQLIRQPLFIEENISLKEQEQVSDKENLSVELISDDIKSWLANLGLSPAWALSLIFLPNSQGQLQALELFGLSSPLVLAEILRLNLAPDEEKLRQKTATGLKQALEKYPDNSPFYIPNLKHLIFDKLEYTLDPMILELTESNSRDFRVRTARVINGDIEATVNWLSKNVERFVPHYTHSFFDRPIESLATYYQIQRGEFAKELRQIIEKEPTNTAILRAALVIAAYTSWPELAWSLWDIWNSLEEKSKSEALLELVWMLSRCGDKSIQSHLSQAIDLAFSTISSERRRENDNSSDLTEKFLRPFGWAVRSRSISPIATQTWIEAAERHLDLRYELTYYVVRYLDHPLAIATFIRGSVDYFGLTLEFGEGMDPLASDSGFERRFTISPIIRDWLWNNLIIDEQEPQMVRERALRVWSWDIRLGDLERLQQITPENAIFEDVLKLRLKQKDTTAREFLLERMRSNPEIWCAYAPLLYHEPGVAQSLLDKFDQAMKGPRSLSAAFIVQYLPPQGVEELIKKHRNLFLKNDNTWVPLWKTEIPAALALLREAIEIAEPGEDNNFELRYMFTGISSFPYPITQIMLAAILPVTDRFPLESLAELAELAVKSGFTNWVRQNLPQVLASRDRAINRWATEEELLAQLNRAGQAIPEGSEATFNNLLLLDFGRDDFYHFQFIHVPKVVKKWVGLPLQPNHLIIAAMLISARGFSPGLDWWLSLEPKGELGQHPVVDKIKNKNDNSKEEAEIPLTQTLHELWSAILSILKIKYWEG